MPKKEPTAAVTAMARAPQKATRREPAAMGAPPVWASRVRALVCDRVRPLVRRARALAAALSGAPRPPPLSSESLVDSLRCLGLPPPLEVAASAAEGGASKPATRALLTWCRHLLPSVAAWRGGRTAAASERCLAVFARAAQLAASVPPRLLPLPALYHDLLMRGDALPCQRCGKPPSEPALCLLCGALLCCAGACCRSSDGCGEVSQHAAVAHGGTAVFLLLRATRLIILRGRRFSMAASPYLDSHGEEDTYLKLGRPLHLVAPRMSDVARVWLAGALDSSATLGRSRLGSDFY